MTPKTLTLPPRSTRPTPSDAERGATMLMVVITLVVLLLSSAIAVDLSIAAARGQILQNAADAAALASVQSLRGEGDAAPLLAAQAVAETTVNDLLVQNGVDLATVTVDVAFPDPVNRTEVQVTLARGDLGTFFDPFTGGGQGVTRSATARLESCALDCVTPIVIPPPVRAIDANGKGDGWTPLVVDHRVYALNHHSSGGWILCVDRNTQDKCWDTIERPAYATGDYTVYTPDAPFAAIHNGVIYWTATTNTGTSVFCWQTVTDTPCANRFSLNDLTGSQHGWNYEQRAGGIRLHNDQLFVFSGDHRVHCIVPQLPMSTCPNYSSKGEPSDLNNLNFPTNRPLAGNRGADLAYTVVDHDAGRLYWATGVTNLDTENVALGKNTLQSSQGWGGASSRAVDGNIDGVYNNGSITHTQWEQNPWWQVDLGKIEPLQEVRLFNRSDCCSDRLSDFWVFISDTDMSSRSMNSLNNDSSVTKLRETGIVGSGAMWTDALTGSGRYVRVQKNTGGYLSLAEVELIGQPGPEYAKGTWLQCWDAVSAAPCANFDSALAYPTTHRSWGRPMLKRGPTGNVVGVCVFAGTPTELPCFHPTTGASQAPFTALRNEVRAVQSSNTDYISESFDFPELNRVYIPASFNHSALVCWDFTTGFCGSDVGNTPAGGNSHDYGYQALDGDCIIGLGHGAYFRSFSAIDITEECKSSSTSAVINPCSCSGELKWGTVNFDVDLVLFDRFEIRILDSTGTQIYPTDGTNDPPPHSLLTDGTSIDLNVLPVTGFGDFLVVDVFVESTQDPWAAGDQVLYVNFNRLPHLTD